MQKTMQMWASCFVWFVIEASRQSMDPRGGRTSVGDSCAMKVGGNEDRLSCERRGRESELEPAAVVVVVVRQVEESRLVCEGDARERVTMMTEDPELGCRG